MLSSQPAAQAAPDRLNESEIDLAGDFPMEMLELELSLDALDGEEDRFADKVRQAAADLNGAFLFDMPASGLVEDCERIAVLRIPRGADGQADTIFACLEPQGSIRIERPNDQTAGLKTFAQAFVDVFQRL
jgi:hypothetical protein